MKKIISILIVAVLFCSMIIPCFAYTKTEGKMAKNNAFEVLYAENGVQIDGVISESEWGKPIKVINVGDPSVINFDESMTPSDDATVYRLQKSEYILSKDTYEVYMRWDEEYLYLGIIMHDRDGDADGYACREYAEDDKAWKNDGQQIKIEPGPANQGSAPYDPFISDQSDTWGGTGSVWFAYVMNWNDATGDFDPIKGNLYNNSAYDVSNPHYDSQTDTVVISGTDYNNQVVIAVDEDDVDNKVYTYEYALSLEFLNLYADKTNLGTLAEGSQWAISIGFINADWYLGDMYHQWVNWGYGGIPITSTDKGKADFTSNGNIGLTLVKELSNPGTQTEEPVVTCEHANAYKINVTEVNCREYGYTGDLYCPDCDTVLEYGEVLPLTEHNFDPEDGICHTLLSTGEECGKEKCRHEDLAEPEGYIPPTCTSTGMSGDIYCEDCNELIEASHELPMIPHNYVDGKCTGCNADAPSVETTGVVINGNIGNAASVTTADVDADTNTSIASKLAENATFKAIDITLHDAGGVEVQPDGSVQVTIDIPAEVAAAEGTLSLYHLNGDDLDKVECKEANGKLTFTTDGFSVYVIAKETAADPTPADPTTPEDPTPADPTTPEDPTPADPTTPEDPEEPSNIGLIIGIIAGVVVIIAVVVVIIIKKKK